jgi:hypothetical protein
VEKFLSHKQRGQRDATPERFAQNQHIGRHSGAGKREPIACSAKAALYLVEDEQGMMPVGQKSSFLEEFCRKHVDSTFTKHGFQQNGAGFL